MTMSMSRAMLKQVLKMVGDLNNPLERGWEPLINVERPFLQICADLHLTLKNAPFSVFLFSLMLTHMIYVSPLGLPMTTTKTCFA